MTKMTAEEANTFLKGAFETQDNRSEVVSMEDGRAVMRLVAHSNGSGRLRSLHGGDDEDRT